MEGKDGYLLTVADYIHLNFARSFISKTMEELVANPETSVGCYVGGKFPEWMEWKKVMGGIGQENLESKARKRFYEHLKRKWGEMREKTFVSTKWLSLTTVLTNSYCATIL